jgi:hypothetical protein
MIPPKNTVTESAMLQNAPIFRVAPSPHSLISRFSDPWVNLPISTWLFPTLYDCELPGSLLSIVTRDSIDANTPDSVLITFPPITVPLQLPGFDILKKH